LGRGDISTSLTLVANGKNLQSENLSLFFGHHWVVEFVLRQNVA
jgi:hypothetical protein